MPPAVAAPPRPNPTIVLRTVLGRTQAPELIGTFAPTMAAPSTFIVNPIPLNRPCESLEIMLRGRLVIGTADYTSVLPEAPQTLLQSLVLQGTHRVYGAMIPWKVSGATLFAYQRCFVSRGNSLLIGTTLAGELGQPLTNGLSSAVQGTYDFEIHWNLPSGFVLDASGKMKVQPEFMWYPRDWGNTMSLQINLGDKTSLGTPGGSTTATWTAFGSGAGTPTLTIAANYAIVGRRLNQPGAIRNGIVVRNEQELSAINTAIANGVRLGILAKQITSNVLVKSGVGQTGMTAGLNGYASLSDVQLDVTQLMVDNKPIKVNQSNPIMKTYMSRQFATVLPQGYFLLSFIEGSQDPLTAYRSDVLAAGSTWEVDTNVLTANAQNRQAIIQEMVYGGPYPVLPKAA